MKQFISVHDAGNINALVEKALMYKADPLKDKTLGAGRRIGLLFLNPSLRTRLSTQVAAGNLKSPFGKFILRHGDLQMGQESLQ